MCWVFAKAVFLLCFNQGFNQPVVHIGSLDPRHCKPGSLHGLTGVISFVVCVCGCVRSAPAWWMKLAEPFLFVCFSSVLSVLLQCGREWKTATCIHWYNTLPPKPPPSVNQQAEWILMEPIYPASVLPPCVQPTSCVTLTWFSVFPSTFCMTLVTLY